MTTGKTIALTRPIRSSRTNTQKRCLFLFFNFLIFFFKDVFFITADWNAKIGSQEIPGVTGKFGLAVQNEAGQRLTEFCQENALVIANTLFQHRRQLYTWTLPDGQY